ncbi:MAG: adenosylcobinamide-phosphate synthase CbiB, partial [Pseudomonadota bacterium]
VPELLWSRFPHPVVVFGKAVGFVDKRLNKDTDNDLIRYRKGALAISVLVLVSLVAGLLLNKLAASLGIAGYVLEAFIVFVLLAQKSLHDHVNAVSTSLAGEGLAGGREAVGMIVGRDPETLDRTGICRAAIESLGENFSDGVVAPALWYLVFGLPGILVYKMINTADSMIAYRSEKYLWFGRAAAHVDDLANWLPARISAVLLAAGSVFQRGPDAAKRALQTAFRDARLHQSPNAGWPESAMAGGLNIALGGPRIYKGKTVPQVFLNSGGRKSLASADIDDALRIFSGGCFALWGSVASVLLIL